AASIVMSWAMAYINLPQAVAAGLIGISDNPFIILLVINLLLLGIGTFMDLTPAVLIFTTILLQFAIELGMDPIHFGIMMVLNLCIGLCTPPVGSVLFVGVGVAETTIQRVLRPILPFYAAMIVALILVAYIPGLSLWLPTLFGL